MNVVEIRNLHKIYKEKDIFKQLRNKKIKKGVEDISFEVREGEIFSLIGLNGAGKTTIMKCILGLLDYDSGKVDIFNQGSLNIKNRKYIGYLPEISYYPKNISLSALMSYYAELLEIKNKNIAIDEILDKVGLLDRKKSKLEDFSKGMLQKVGIAQSILNKPKLLCLDEPMSGLDPIARSEMIELLKELKDEGTSIFLNTHILNDIEKIGDRGIIVHEGKIIDKFDLKEFLKKEIYIIEYSDQNKIEVCKEELGEALKAGEIVDVYKESMSLENYFKMQVNSKI